MKTLLLATASCTFIAAAALGAGADIIIGDVNGIQNWGGVNGTAAYSLGSTKCNTGDVILAWQQFTNQHYLGGGNIYRLSTVDGASRFEQIGQAWLHHGFCALQQFLCGTCMPVGGGCASALGIGCSEPNTPASMGSQNNLGPRYDVNASTGQFTFPLSSISTGGVGLLGKRTQISNNDLNPSLNPGAEYFGEFVTVHPQDATDGHAGDNTSYRRLLVGALSGTAPNQYYPLSVSGPTIRQLPALNAWETTDPTVQIAIVDVPSDGRFFIGFDATDLGNGQWHYEYAIFNLSSHRSGQSFSVPVSDGVTVTNIGFKDVDYHTQEILAPEFRVDNVDWTAAVLNSAITWSTAPFSGPPPAGNEHTANALRWGTLDNFRFDANAPPRMGTATLALFRPGTPDEVSIELLGPGAPLPCPADLSGDDIVNGFDLALLLGEWGTCNEPCAADLDDSGSVNGVDLATLLAAWGLCPLSGGSECSVVFKFLPLHQLLDRSLFGAIISLYGEI